MIARKIPSVFKKYSALTFPLLGGIVMVVLQAYNQVLSDGVTASEWVTVVIQGFSLVTIWMTANVPGYEKAKPWMAALMVVLNLLVSYIVDGLTGAEVSQLIVAFLGAVGAFAAPGPVAKVAQE